MSNDLISRSELFEDLNNNKIPVNVDINEIIRNQPTVNQWIDVNDRLPEKDTEVLVCFDDGFIAIVFFGEDFDLGVCIGELIAWMPLPKPYKKGEC